jgi:hypothetical protein
LHATPEPGSTQADHASHTGRQPEQCRYQGPSWSSSLYCFFAAHEKFWVSFGTTVLAIVTLILGGATAFLYRATRALVKGAEQTAGRQLRAYAFIELTSVKLNRVGKLFLIEVGYVLTNTGQTPAYKVKVDSDFRILVWPLPAAEKIEAPKPNPLAFAPAIGPNQTKTGTLTKVMTIDAALLGKSVGFISLSNSRECLYVVALVRYEDAFGVSRHTEYCGSFQNLAEVVAAGDAGRPVPKAQFMIAEQYNDAS